MKNVRLSPVSRNLPMQMADWHGLVNLAMLFASKAGGALVVLFFMPLYYKLLGAEQFGMVSVILSLQALLVMLDFGMSTMVGRDVALFGGGSSNAQTIWRNAEMVLTILYTGIFVFALAWGAIRSPIGLSVLSIVTVVILFWTLVLQNVGQTVLLAAKSFMVASTIQLFGALLKAVATVIALRYLAGTLLVFIAAQLLTTIAQLLLTRWACNRVLIGHSPESFQIKNDIAGCIELLKRGKALFVFGLAGAAVMQLDKPIIAAFVSAKAVSTYFLAVTFCMAPIAVLAGPVAQYFQPHFISLVSQANPKESQRVLLKFVYVLVLVTILPSMALWFYRELWLVLWLGNSPSVSQVISYVAVLLPGVAIGALGYIPFTILTAQQDYHFQARLSATMTMITLTLVGYFAYQQNVYAICYVYASYHSVSTIASWARAIILQQTSEDAKDALLFAIKFLVSITAIAYVVKFSLDGRYQIKYQSIVFILAMFLVGVLSSVIYLKAQRNKLT